MSPPSFADLVVSVNRHRPRMIGQDPIENLRVEPVARAVRPLGGGDVSSLDTAASRKLVMTTPQTESEPVSPPSRRSWLWTISVVAVILAAVLVTMVLITGHATGTCS
jgi:hypothetical protein